MRNSRLDHATDLAGTELARGKQLEDPAPNRITQDVECVHGSIIASGLI